MSGRIEIRDLAVSFPTGIRGERLVAIDALDLVVEPRQIVALIGPNGSGKSTLLRVIAGLLAPDRGSIELDGQPVAGPDRQIGLVFQESRLLPWRSTASNVGYPLELAGVDRIVRERRVGTMLETVGLAGAAAMVPSQLSGGMRQRAALARTLALEPEVLLLDELFSALRAHARAPQPRAARDHRANVHHDPARDPLGAGGGVPRRSCRSAVRSPRSHRGRRPRRAAAPSRFRGSRCGRRHEGGAHRSRPPRRGSRVTGARTAAQASA